VSYVLQFGSYVFPKGFYPAEEPLASQVSAAKLPRADGARVLTGLLEKKVLKVRGGLIHDSGLSVRTKVDALKAALQGGPANLYFDSDRYWRQVQKESSSFGYESGTHYGRIVTVEIDFVTGDPFVYEVAAQNVSQAIASSPTTVPVTAGGNAPALPQWSLTVGGVGAVTLAATVTNTTTGEAFTLAGAVSGGDVIVVDSLAETVKIGGVDKMSLFDGLFPKLAVGANSIQIAYTSGTISNFAADWNNRWY